MEVTKIRPMEIDEFIEEILKGKRNFRNISLYRVDFSSCKLYEEMQNYLKKQEEDLLWNPIDISYSDLREIKAPGLFFPGVKGYSTNLSGANLEGADLSKADLSKANLSGANLSWADLYEANLSGANLSWADLYGVNLKKVKGLDSVKF